MNLTTLETEIAQAAKRYVAAELHLDVRAFAKTRDRAWVSLAGRFLEKPVGTTPAGRLTSTGARQ